ncbi:MAG: cbb3-type cytochrome c oxidase N-terminal domain-containing protein [Gemmatimonadales bacterium]
MTKTGDDRPLMDHQYDGIQEYDNPMPRWWVWLFVVTILFVPVYYLAPGNIGNGAKRAVMYENEMAAFRAAHPESLGPPAMTDDELTALVANPARIVEGKALFAVNCVVCHRADGGGLIGPNLTDDYWIHGGTTREVRTTIWNGVLAKGMPPWGKLLKPDQVNSLLAFVKSLHGTNPPNPKAPDGTLVTPDKPAP